MPKRRAVCSGIRVLDFSSMVSGPFCTRLLADCGAEVVKVEPPEGDLLRQAPPAVGAASRYFAAFNCGKKSIVLDLKRAEDVHSATRLAARCDVLVENSRPGVMARLGLDADRLCRANPRLVYCSISGFGQTGSMAGWPAYAPIVHALSGFDRAFLGYQPRQDQPPVCGIQLADVLAGTFAFGAIQAALLNRERTGNGEQIDVSLIESIMAAITGDLQAAQVAEDVPIPSYAPIRAKDDFIIVAIISPKSFEGLCQTIDESWRTDPRFDRVASRQKHMPQLLALVEQWTRERTAEECQRVLMANGVPCARYELPASVLDNEHLRTRGTFATLRDEGGAFHVNNAPFQFRRAVSGIRTGAPKLGEHAEGVLSSWLGGPDEGVDRSSS